MKTNTPVTSVNVLPSVADWLADVNTRFADNKFGETTEEDFRRVFAGAAEVFASWRNLSVKRVKGATFPVPFIDSLELVPAEYRILGMQAVALNGVDASTAAAGVIAPQVFFTLLKNAVGLVNAFVDTEPTTTTTVKAAWVQTSGTNDEKTVSYPVLPLEDAPLDAGDVYQYTFTNLTPAVTRLFEVRVDLNQTQNPLPTGLDNDPYYKPFAPLVATSDGVSQEYVDAANAEQQAAIDAVYDYIDTLQTGTTLDEKNRIAGRYIISTAGVVRTYGTGGTALNTALNSLVSGETFSFAHGGRQTSALPPSGRLFDGITVLGNGFVWSVGTSSYGYLAMLNCLVSDLTIQGTASEYAYMSGANSRFNNCALFYVTAVTMNAAQTAMVPNAVITFSGSRLNFVRYPAAFTVEYLNGTVSTNESRLNGNGANSGVKVRYQATLPDADGTYALQVAAGVYTYAAASAGGSTTGAWPPLTNPVTDNVDKFFRATLPADFRTNDAEYTTNGGTSWTTASDGQRSGDVLSVQVSGAKAAGQVQLRMRADDGRAASSAVSNATAFTALLVNLVWQCDNQAITYIGSSWALDTTYPGLCYGGKVKVGTALGDKCTWVVPAGYSQMSMEGYKDGAGSYFKLSQNGQPVIQSEQYEAAAEKYPYLKTAPNQRIPVAAGDVFEFLITNSAYTTNPADGGKNASNYNNQITFYP